MQDMQATKVSKPRQTGFTLVELMIVVAIVGILASIAYPAFLEHTRRAKRTDGKALITDISARLERYFFENNRYTTALQTNLGFPSDPAPSADRNYTATVGPRTNAGSTIANSYLITATPVAGTFADPKCGALTLDSKGIKGAGGNINECWR